MERVERSGSRKPREKSSDRRPSRSPRRESRGGFEDHQRSRRPSGRRPSGRGRPSGRRDSGRGRREVEMTKVTCSECGERCEVPFKPTSTKPVYCSDCFEKKEKSGSGRRSNKDFDIINEKLDKIMEALEI